MPGLSKLSDRHLLALHRVAKTRGRAFFRHPHLMRDLRNEIIRRGIK